MLIKWTTDLSVKNDVLDAEHQRWIELLNAFYQGLKDGRSKESLVELIEGMIEYTKYHFANEEKYMLSIGYPDLKQHKVHHAEYVQKLSEYHRKILDGKMVLSLEVTNYLKNWLINHIKGIDMQYVKFSND
jgi:hemerythrin